MAQPLASNMLTHNSEKLSQAGFTPPPELSLQFITGQWC